MKQTHMRPAFSMITAIFVIVIMASIGAFVMNLSGKIVKTTTAQFQHEQAMLYAKSYTEFAVMAVSANDRSANCMNNITGSIGSDPDIGNGYDVNVSISYIGASAILGSCSSERLNTSDIVTPDTPLTIIVDAYVRYKDPDNTDGPWFTVHRRTIQKI